MKRTGTLRGTLTERHAQRVEPNVEVVLLMPHPIPSPRRSPGFTPTDGAPALASNAKRLR